MGHIKEPKGVDFIIQSRPLTKEEELAISEHIKNYKLKSKIVANKPKKSVKKRKAEMA
jgi:hypothetical protein